jgi:hypothetical protein
MMYESLQDKVDQAKSFSSRLVKAMVIIGASWGSGYLASSIAPAQGTALDWATYSLVLFGILLYVRNTSK